MLELNKRNLLRIAFVLALLAGATHLYFRFRVAPAMLLPQLHMRTLEGIPVKAEQGQPTLLLFFATWCRDCRQELPVLAQLEKSIAEKNIRVILLIDEPVETIKAFSNSVPSRFELLQLQGSFSDNGIHTLPTSYLFCSDGSTYLKKTGAIEWSEALLSDFVATCPKK